MNYANNNMKTVTMMITPEIAQEMLESNTDSNRKLKTKYVHVLSDIMARGAFTLSPQGISFDKTGKLIDGQHRLHAVVRSGCTVPMRVTTGCDPAAFEVLDIGSRRNVRDIATIYDAGPWYKATAVSSAFAALAKRRNPALAKTLTPGEVFKLLKANDNVARVLYQCTVSKLFTMINSTARGALLEALLVTGNVDALLAFRNVFALGKRPENDSYYTGAVHAFKNRIVQAKLKHTTIDKDEMWRFTQACFYKFVNGNTNKRIKFSENDCYVCDINALFNGEYDPRYAGIEVDCDGTVVA